MFYNLYIDLVFDDNSPHFETIKKKIENIKINIFPAFNPGKNFFIGALFDLTSKLALVIIELLSTFEKVFFLLVLFDKDSFLTFM